MSAEVIFRIASIAAIFLLSSAEGAPASHASWLSECIGRVEVSLPIDAEPAVTPRARIESMLAIRPYHNEPDYSFPDGQVAGYTSLGYSGGDTLVSEPVTTRELDSWLVAYRTVLLTKIRKQTQGRRAVDGTQFVVTPVSLDSPRSSAYHLYGPRYDVALAVGDRLLQTAITSTTSDVDGGHAFLESFVKSVSPRALFELPGGPGVFLPKSLIRDDKGHPTGLGGT